MRHKLIKTIATFFYIGYLPLMPGTWASLAGVLVYLLVRHNIYLLLAAFAVLLSAGLYAAGKAEDIFGKKDDKRIVIDEVCGMLLVFILIPPYKSYLIAGFIIYRLFDILKPYPARRLEKLPRSLGIMSDDVLVALYSFLMVRLLLPFFKVFY